MSSKPITSDWVAQVEIGLAALEAGFIAADEFATAFREVYSKERPPTVDELWVTSGRLSPNQLEEVLRSSQFNHDTHPAPSSVTTHTVRVSGTMGAVGPRNAKMVAEADTTERYLRIRNLGRGGMGEITECLDNRLGRKVAVKTVRKDQIADPESCVMLEREARVTGNLEHPGIVPVHDVGVHAALGSYYVMRRLEMPTLAAILTPLKKYEAKHHGEYSLTRLLRYFIQLCEVAEYAHSRGVIHCDLKPANILIGTYGEVMVLDWGLAFRKDKGTGYRGGTPGYMAPEQASNSAGVDERTDCYSLGVILYEIVALAYPYDIGDVMTYDFDNKKIPCAPSKPPRLPSERARAGRVPPELDETCMKALELLPEHRFQSAKALAAAVEAYLEGTAERERRQRRADDLAAQGEMLAENYHDFVASRPERVDELDEVRNSIPTWETSSAKQALWDAEDRLEVMDALGVRMLHSATATYEQALDELPTHAGARRGLARLYLAEYRRAADRRDEIARVYFEELINQYDDGRVRSEMTADGIVSISSNPPARVTLSRVEQVARRLVPRTSHLTETPTGAVRLLPGSYLALLELPDRSVRYPIELQSEQELAIDLDLGPASELGPDEIYIPGGLTKIGGDEDGRDLRIVDVPSFIIGTFPVTFGEYFAFLVDVANHDPVAASRHVPRSSSGEPYWRWARQSFEPTSADTVGYTQEQFLTLPTFGIDAHSAIAYLDWKSTRTGRAYRLPNELEWERAGRGADGRLFPWGQRFDASFCKMRESSPGLPKPERSGLFAEDTSPFGVRDLAGGIAEWVFPLERSDGRMMTRGGAWCDFANDCRLSARRLYLAVEFSARIGFRFARSV